MRNGVLILTLTTFVSVLIASHDQDVIGLDFAGLPSFGLDMTYNTEPLCGGEKNGLCFY